MRKSVWVILFVVLSGCGQKQDARPELTAAESDCVSRVLDSAIAEGLREAEEGVSSIDLADLSSVFDEDLVDEAIEDRDLCTAYAACFPKASTEKTAMYLQNCTRDRMRERVDSWL